MRHKLVLASILFGRMLSMAGASELRMELVAQGAEESSVEGGVETVEEAPDSDALLPAGRPVLELSLSEAVQLTLSKNLGTKISGVQQLRSVMAVERARGAYDASLSSSLSAVSVQRSTTSALESGQGQFISKDYTLDSSVSQALPIGGSYRLRLQTQRSESNSPFELLDTTYNSSLSFSVSYPLLEGFGGRSLKTPVQRAELSAQIAELQLEQSLQDAVVSTQNAYLDLILARENLKVQQESLRLAKELLEVARAQQRVGTLAPIEVLSAESAVALREEGLILAEAGVLSAEDVLRQSLNLPESLQMWQVGIEPTDAPGHPEGEYSLEEAVQLGLQRRPDVRQAKLGLQSQRLQLKLSRDQLRPRLDVGGSFALIGNSQLGLGLDETGEVTVVQKGDIFVSHLEDLLSADNFVWTAQFSLSQPLGNRAAQGQHRDDKLELERQLLSLRQLELGAVAEIRLQLRSIRSARKRVTSTQVARELAQRRLEAEEKKFQVGTSTSHDVLDFQEDVVTANKNYTQAIIDLNRAVLGLQKAVGMTLEVNQISVQNGRPVVGSGAVEANR